MWVVYLLRCDDGSFYTGITTNLKKRMEKHRSGSGSKYVRAKGFDKLLYGLQLRDKSSAASLEYEIKEMKKERKKQFFQGHENLIYEHVNPRVKQYD